jgi:hypothetical protein
MQVISARGPWPSRVSTGRVYVGQWITGLCWSVGQSGRIGWRALCLCRYATNSAQVDGKGLSHVQLIWLCTCNLAHKNKTTVTFGAPSNYILSHTVHRLAWTTRNHCQLVWKEKVSDECTWVKLIHYRCALFALITQCKTVTHTNSKCWDL